jgi:hypothetical protein
MRAAKRRSAAAIQRSRRGTLHWTAC